MSSSHPADDDSNKKVFFSLTAAYASPAHAPFRLAHDLPAPASGTAAPTVPDKTAYLRGLRAAAAALQAQVNTELTRRMEEDNDNKARGEAEASKNNDAKEEENYGQEEAPEEEED